ncbi:Conserved_hypothetical protein [Hexamita inflata]|uniref:Uncharacterized protein n=1 Tax=Hexamita inflata TaxID=28002 RepID=A0AA86Q761_9EUKA|nr:Conserved hypothetical protein [Hexamita inflata]
MIVVHVLMVSVSSSFSECFSAKSYISGNVLTDQLNLHLLPFERLDRITNENLCQMYLPNKVVVAQIHYDDISFPRPGEDEVNFLYKFNQEIVVTFQLTHADYEHIFDKNIAMYELWYDVNLVKVNNSVNTIEHTKYNGTNCFQKLEMEYTIYEDIDIKVLPNNCNVKIDANIQVYIEFQEGQVNNQIPIYPCVSSCDPTEFQLSLTNFSQIRTYHVKKTPATASRLSSFYSNFVENRRIQISLNLKFDTNGIYTAISNTFNNVQHKDNFACKSLDSHLGIYALLNPNVVSVQYRDSLVNKLVCDISAKYVKVDLYMFDNVTSVNRKSTYKIQDFDNSIGIEFQKDSQFTLLRENFQPSGTKTTVVVSYLSETHEIMWEILIYSDPVYIGCVERATLHLYENHNCLEYILDKHDQCVVQKMTALQKNVLGIYYKSKGIQKSLGMYRFHYAVDYSISKHEVCFVCEEYQPGVTYAKPSCEENQKLTKQLIKTEEIGFGIVSACEFIIFNTAVTEYKSIYVPVILSSSLICVLVIITIITFVQKL